MRSFTLTIELPDDLVDAVTAAGPLEFGAVAAAPDEVHLAHFARTLARTREDAYEGDRPMFGLYKTGTDVVLAHTGTTDTAEQRARILDGLWNALHAIVVHAPDVAALAAADRQTVTLHTTEGKPNSNGVIFSASACEDIARILREKPLVPVMREYATSAPGTVRDMIGVIVPGTAAFDGSRITVAVDVFDVPQSRALFTELKHGTLALGTSSVIDDAVIPPDVNGHTVVTKVVDVLNLSCFRA